MTSRERVLQVLRHQIPDYLPNCWGGCETAGLHVLAYHELVAELGLPPRPSRANTFMFNAVMDEDVLLKIQGDMLLLASPIMCTRPLRARNGWKMHQLFDIPIELTDNYTLEFAQDGMTYLLDHGKRAMRCPASGMYFDFMPNDNMFSDEEVPDPALYHPQNHLTDEKLRMLENLAKSAWESTEFSLCMGETITDLQLMPGGMVAWYDVMINEPEIVDEYLFKNVDLALEQLTMLEQAIGKYCDVLAIAHDLGDSKGVSIGAPMFRSCYKPHYKRLFEGWHQRTGMKINFHSCGAISEIIPDLVECGVDILNPVQISAAAMSAESVRQLAGDQLVLMGGAFDCIQNPPHCNAEIVYEQVKKNIAMLGNNGNFLFAGVHNTAANTPKEHLKAVLRAYQDMRNMYVKH